MKKLLMMLTLLLAMGMTCAMAEEPDMYVCDDWWYTLQEDGTAEIFRYDSGETNVIIPETLDGHPVTAIADSEYVFFNAKCITIPDCLTRIGTNPLSECDGLTEIRVSQEHPTLAVIDGLLYEKTEKRLVCYPAGLARETIDIPQGIRIIGKLALSGSSDLKHITIPDSVTTIDDWAFASCSALEEVVLPDSVTRIGDYSFFWCDAFTSITIPDSVVEIGANPFTNCRNLEKIRVSPDHPTLAVIDGVLFEKTQKRLVCYPMTLTNSAYSIPQGIRVIGGAAFRASVLTSIDIPDSVTTIENEAFLGCDMAGILLPDSVTAIGDEAFASCRELKEITIPGGVTELGKDVFDWCSDDLLITVSRDSAAARYCKENDLNYTYPDSLDWLLN